MLPSLTSSKKSSAPSDVPLGDRNHQPQVGLDDLVLDLARPRRTAARSRPSRCVLALRGSSFSRSFVGLVLQVVELAEQVILLLARQQRHFVQEARYGGKPAGHADLLALVASGPASAAESPLPMLGLPKLSLGMKSSGSSRIRLRPHLVDDAVDAGPRAAETPRQRFDRHAAAILLIDLLLGFVRQWPVPARETPPDPDARWSNCFSV